MSRLSLLITALVFCLPLPAQQRPDHGFETPPVQPILLSPDGARLYVCHPGANRVAEFSLADPGYPVLLRELVVGLGPVSLALRGSNQLWVVNRVGDSLSVVDLERGVVVRRLRCVDDPCDLHIDEAGGRVFVSSGSRDVVQVLSLKHGREITRIAIPGAEPTVLRASRDGTRLHVLVHKSGNGTTIVPANAAPKQPAPLKATLPSAPKVPLIVRADDPKWSATHGVSLPDHDVVTIDVQAMLVTGSWKQVGTIQFDLVRRPGTDTLFATGTEAHNLVRFEDQLVARFAEHRIARLDAKGVQVHDLHTGVDPKKLPNPSAKAIALAQPTGLAFDPSGTELWVAGFGSDRLGVVDPDTGRVLSRVELGDAAPKEARPRSKRGPRSLAFHPRGEHVYAFQWLSASVAVIDAKRRSLLRELPLGDVPERQYVREGRGFLYDARLSGNGLASCAVCHVDARRDDLAWDLGERDGELVQLDTMTEPIVTFELHPMKGPLLTQTMIGLSDEQPFHWRGDKSSLFEFDEVFEHLLGGQKPSLSEMNDFIRYLQSLQFPANPNQELDRSYRTTPYGESAADGKRFFETAKFQGGPSEQRCTDCHTRPSGSSEQVVVDREVEQYISTPHLRDLYLRARKRPDVAGVRRSGYGLSHAGQHDGVAELLGSGLIFFGKLGNEPRNQRMLERFLLSFDTGTAPAVGLEVLLTAKSRKEPEEQRYLAVLLASLAKGEAELLASGELAGKSILAEIDPKSLELRFADAARASLPLGRAIAELKGSDVLRLWGVPPQQGSVLGIDRDQDGRPDLSELPRRYGSGALRLESNGQARIGRRGFGLYARGLQPGERAFVLLGVQPAKRSFASLTLWVDPQFVLPIEAPVDARGTTVLAVPLPDAPSWAGLRLYAQLLAMGPTGLRGSDALELLLHRN